MRPQVDAPRRSTPVVLAPDIVVLLQEMGLAWDEVRIYQFLLNASASISSVIVRETGHSRGRIYEALRRLVEKGLVREEPTRPIRFHPTPLAEILAAAHVRLTKQLAAVKAGQGVALQAPDAPVALPLVVPTSSRDVRVFSGRRACHAEWSRMLAGAQRFFWLTGGVNFAKRLAAMPEFLQRARRAHEEGLSVQIVLPGTQDTSKPLKTMAERLGPEVLQVATADEFGPLVSCTTDQAALEIISQPDDDAPNQGDDVAIQVSSELFATATKHRVELAEAFLKKTGTPPVYQWLGPSHGSDLFLDAIRRAKRDVMVLGPTAWGTYLAHDWSKNASTYRQARDNGVRFRAVTTSGEGAAARLAPFADVWDIRVGLASPVWLTLIDGKELYQAFAHPSLDGPPQFRRSIEPNEIAFYAAVFDRLWATATAF